MTVNIMVGDCREVLKGLASESVNCIVTSPPYFGLRDYGMADQIGLEPTPDEFVAALVGVLGEARRVLRGDGTLWLNLGDTYNNNPSTSDIPRSAQGNGSGAFQVPPEKHVQARRATPNKAQPLIQSGIKKKDLIGIPWRVAFALQADGWYLRQDIIWHKPNPMPESVTDRCTKSHEYVFLLAKSTKYHYDADAISEAVTASTVDRLAQDVAAQTGSLRVPGKTNGAMKAVGRVPTKATKASGNYSEGAGRNDGGGHRSGGFPHDLTRNKRSVWSITTQPYSEAHFATMAPELAETCIKAGCPVGGTVLDPFGGAGTTGLVADRLSRNAILIELNPAYAELARNRISDDAGMFGAVA